MSRREATPINVIIGADGNLESIELNEHALVVEKLLATRREVRRGWLEKVDRTRTRLIVEGEVMEIEYPTGGGSGKIVKRIR